jgi:hypothetical protein
MDLPPSDIVPLSASIRKRFYEPVIILNCVSRSCVEGRRVETVAYETAPPKSLEQTYSCFVDKLGQICDTQQGGATVTSFGILWLGTVRYWFASNQRNATQLDEVKDYLTRIFSTLHGAVNRDVSRAIKNPQHPLYSVILQSIIRFNRPRMERYIERLSRELEVCVEEICEVVDSEDEYFSAEESVPEPSGAHTPPQALNILLQLAQFARKRPKVNEENYVVQTQTLLHTLARIYDGEVEDFVREKCIAERAKLANQGAHGNLEEPLRTSWDEAYHCAGRLLSYFLAVKIILSARRYWPELFDDFEVVALPSSRRDRDPPSMRRSAERIIKSMDQACMADGQSILNVYRQNAADLQAWGLDRRIQEVTHHSHFKPFVHTEVLVDDAIRRARHRAAAAGQEPIEFFRESEFGRYIGSSKPTCRLCALYFAAQPDGVAVRPSHGNLYHNWRVPDVFASDGIQAEQRMNAVLDRMVARLREETWRAIRSKSAPWRAWDSNNTATNPLPDRMTATTSTGTDALSVQVAGMSIS